MQPTIIDLAEVKRLTTLSRSSIYALAKMGRFPQPYRIKGTSRTVWKTADVQKWIDENVIAEGQS
ncbi:helix-turn-helix transcriptional regulator [Acidithiobacillus caldus]|jgi:prophage regulatory protein|uniref:DNA-binding protein, putative n=1 Tax=Acidithiobacillus caldus (strain SM-1) TaxID=990288 RepID=F9ZPV0_ACICS|nr:AlpA family phage regulatory protein [Acidithiobacillus caldus]AEK58491.1 DNA-binding protein, putative [Acidithiobacillus caldus SM-1]AUW33072.1 AlpA family phage regulatory protein [Acidithiobacillus caldus]MBU2731176.1 AlpA family phage regulatory protein [Acidithiobacillus caldus]MBU2734421.1 AlpA family phage regulatory protein [Acidithiobacillus caldus ATCC 51756]MBU2745391.1 AlpA family phage regulatory protein [Acidithiobacillus caldus]